MKKHVILLVDDDELDVISVKRSLKKLNTEYEFYSAFNGNEALAILKNSQAPVYPDIILLDLSMPKMNGIEFLDVLRKDEMLKDIKVIIMTTSTESKDINATKSLGVSGYIIKPLNYDSNTKKAESMNAFIEFHLRKILAEK